MSFSWWLHKSSLGLIVYDDFWAIPLLFKILFLLLVTFCWFCNSSYYFLATFFFKFSETTFYLFIYINRTRIQGTRKSIWDEENKGKRYKRKNHTKVQTLYSSSKFAISSSNQFIFLSIASMASSRTSHLTDRTILSSKNTLQWTMSDSISNCSVNPQWCLGDRDQTRWDDDACDNWKASITSVNQCRQ